VVRTKCAGGTCVAVCVYTEKRVLYANVTPSVVDTMCYRSLVKRRTSLNRVVASEQFLLLCDVLMVSNPETQFVMRRDLVSFLFGIVVGVVLGALLDEEDKKKIYRSFGKQAEQLRKKYAHPVKESVAKVKHFVKEHLH